MDLFDEMNLEPDPAFAEELGEPAPNVPMTFEQMEQRLNEIARQLETEQLTLDVATGLYAEGMELAGRCHAMLEAAQLQVQEIPVPGIGGNNG